MSVCFDIINIHGLLVLLNACDKISHSFVGGQLFFLLHAHLPWEIRSPRSLSELASHVLSSEVTQTICTVSFHECSWVIGWEATAHLWQLSVITLWKNVFWCHFLYCVCFQLPQEDFLEHSLTVVVLDLLRHSWHPFCVSDRHWRKGFCELSWTWGCIKEARWALFMGICF